MAVTWRAALKVEHRSAQAPSEFFVAVETRRQSTWLNRKPAAVRAQCFDDRHQQNPRIIPVLFHRQPLYFPAVRASYDVIIAGLGAMGSAAAFHLAQRGQRVLGLDQFTPPHTFGSSHGQTRIIRQAYFENPCYVPLLLRAYELWSDLEDCTDQKLLHITGGLMVGRPESSLVRGALQSSQLHNLPHELLESHEMRRRFPALHPERDMVALFEPRAGVLIAEKCVQAHLDLARKSGATLQFNDPVTSWNADGTGIRVQTLSGEYRATSLVLTSGAWLTKLLPDLQVPLSLERQVQFWFDPIQRTADFQPGRCPIHLWEFDSGRFFYSIPDFGHGVKVARHHEGIPTSPESIERVVSPIEIEDMRQTVRRFMPGADGEIRDAESCIYTNTPDGHFWVDRHPHCNPVLIASPCSGHGFKFAAVLGEVIADLICNGQSRFDLNLFRTRF